MTDGLSVSLDHQQGAFGLEASFTAPGGVTALFGRSGSGKTTLVNAVAGLIRPRRARIAVGSSLLVDTEAGVFVPPHRRRIGYVFQEGRLFPHLSVRTNLLFGRAFTPRGPETIGLAEVVDLLGIGHLLGRRPAALSGGEKQRVAIGRALLARPRLLLMDEPLASLDDSRKAEILPFIERLRDAARLPILYVSHSLTEVARLADTVVVLDAGRVAASGPADAVFASLDTTRSLRGRDRGARLDAVVEGHDERFGLTVLATGAGRLFVPRTGDAVGARLRLRIAARDAMIGLEAPSGLSALNVLPGTVLDWAEEGASAVVRVACGDTPILAEITRKSVDALGLAPGRSVVVIVKTVSFESNSPG